MEESHAQNQEEDCIQDKVRIEVEEIGKDHYKERQTIEEQRPIKDKMALNRSYTQSQMSKEAHEKLIKNTALNFILLLHMQGVLGFGGDRTSVV